MFFFTSVSTQEQELDVSSVIQRLFPVGKPGCEGFSPLDPRAADMDLDEKGKAKTLHLIISRLFVPLVRKGEGSKALLLAAIDEVLGLCQTSSSSMIGELGTVFLSAVADLEGACHALQALLNPLHKDSMKTITELTGAKRGPLFLLRQTISTNAYYKDLLAEIERTAVAEASFAPVVLELQQKVESGSEEALQECIEKLSLFRGSLRQGATQSIEAAISKNLVADLTRSSQDSEALNKLEERLQFAMRASQQMEGEPRQGLNKVISQTHQVLQKKLASEKIAAFWQAAKVFGMSDNGELNDEEVDPDLDAWRQLIDSLSALKEAQLCKEPPLHRAGEILVHSCMSKMDSIIEQATDTDILEHARDVLQAVAADVCEDAQLICKEGSIWMLLAKLIAAIELVKTEGGPQAFVNSDGDRKKCKALLDSYVSCVQVQKDGVNQNLLAYHQKRLSSVKQTMQEVAQAEVSGFKTGLLQAVRAFEPALAGLLSWKEGLDKTAAWKTVLEAAEKSLLAPGKGAEIQQHWKIFCKAPMGHSTV